MAPQAPTITARRDVTFLLRRITQGFNLNDLRNAMSLGYEGTLEAQLDHLSIDDSELDGRLAAYETTLNLSSEVLYHS